MWDRAQDGARLVARTAHSGRSLGSQSMGESAQAACAGVPPPSGAIPTASYAETWGTTAYISCLSSWEGEGETALPPPIRTSPRLRPALVTAPISSRAAPPPSHLRRKIPSPRLEPLHRPTTMETAAAPMTIKGGTTRAASRSMLRAIGGGSGSRKPTASSPQQPIHRQDHAHRIDIQTPDAMPFDHGARRSSFTIVGSRAGVVTWRNNHAVSYVRRGGRSQLSTPQHSPRTCEADGSMSARPATTVHSTRSWVRPTLDGFNAMRLDGEAATSLTNFLAYSLSPSLMAPPNSPSSVRGSPSHAGDLPKLAAFPQEKIMASPPRPVTVQMVRSEPRSPAQTAGAGLLR